MSKAFGYGNSIILLKDEKTHTHHLNNNQKIKDCLDNFMTKNNLDYKDFVICGSSCASYMDYFILNNVRDIDVFVKDKPREEVILTEHIDVLRYISTPSCLERLEVRDNFQFLSKVDLLVSMAVGGLRKMKEIDFYYVTILLMDLNMSFDELIELVTEELTQMNYLSDEQKTTIVSNIPFMKIYVAHRMREINGDMEYLKIDLQL